MRSLRLLPIAVLCTLGISSWSQPPGGLQKPSRQEVFQAVWKTINDQFYDPSFAGVDWKAIGEKYRPQVDQVPDDAAFLALMGRMLKELPVSHLRIVTGGAGTTGINVRARLVEGQLVVTELPPLSDARRKGVLPGDVILSPSADIAGAPGSTAKLRVMGADGRERTLEVRREYVSVERPAITWQTVTAQPGRQIGYLRVRRFEEASVPQIDAAMAELKSTSGLIIDLRDNPGGTNSFVRLASYFIPGQQLVSGMLTRRYLTEHRGERVDPSTLTKSSGVYSLSSLMFAFAATGAISLYTEDMGEKVYRGRVVLLTNGATASSGEAFVAYVKYKTKATVIGRTTAGQLLTSNTSRLPNGWQLVYPMAVPVAPDGSWFKDTPLPPDIEVKWTLQDVREGRDPDIEKALDVFASPP